MRNKIIPLLLVKKKKGGEPSANSEKDHRASGGVPDAIICLGRELPAGLSPAPEKTPLAVLHAANEGGVAAAIP